MMNLLTFSEIIAGIGIGLTAFYWRYKAFIHSPQNDNLTDFRKHHYENLLRLQSLCGYNPQSLVGISGENKIWFDFAVQSGAAYSDFGKIRLTAGDILASDENLPKAVSKFLAQAGGDKTLPVFLPATEKFACAVLPFGYQAVKIGASPYFDLPNWNPKGNRAKKMRAGCNQAKRAGIRVEQVFCLDVKFRLEVLGLCEKWLDSRCAGFEFGGLFALNPFRHSDLKKYFAARDANGKLIGFLAASPMPARQGWYLEDFLRFPDSPRGSNDLLVYETLKTLAAEGYKTATLGTVPLSDEGDDLFPDNCRTTKKILLFSRKKLARFYNFEGLYRFKSKFVPDFWESEYALIPRKNLSCRLRL